jgi:hypothetical protein
MEKETLEIIAAAVNLAAAFVAALGTWAQVLAARRQRAERRVEPPARDESGNELRPSGLVVVREPRRRTIPSRARRLLRKLGQK